MKLFHTLSTLLILTSTLHAEVTCRENENQIVITRAGKHVLSSQKTLQVPEGVPKKYGRSGYIHPISTPSGRVITDGYPMPHHAHQHGLFFAWRKASFEGREINFWEHGRDTVRHERVLEIMNSGDQAGFVVELAHVSGDLVILRETWKVIVHADTGHIDLDSEQRCVAESPLTLEKFHYGAMAIRGSRQWFKDAHTAAGKGATMDEFVALAKLLTNEGLNEKTGNHSRPTWVSMTGPVDGATVTITMIPHASNYRYPQHVRLHPSMPYFCFIPTVEEPFQIKENETWKSRYRIIAQDGSPDPQKLNAEREVFNHR